MAVKAPTVKRAVKPLPAEAIDIWPGPRECVWPFGDPLAADFRFCCAKRESDRRYCDAHYARAFRGKDEDG